ncbi:AF4/FMR2 family member 1-like [Pristis pectinata]|uniref:AF4/FMR2 family member 1-like n=1 Tax=Pristis pectinata TaxID=685728 RepID=UPI00223CC6CF|nr:AF4/FMR2 family member 1-like [Pristis pectinata]
MATHSSLYNEDRNLLRIKERERRNQEIHLNKEPYLENAPLFGEPYKTNKGDELSNRIQNMLGNYEEMKDLINNTSQQNFIGIPKRAVPLISQEKCSLGPNRSNSSMQPSFHSKNPRLMGPHSSAPSTVDYSSQKSTALTEQNGQSSNHNAKNYKLLHNRSQNKNNSYNGRETCNRHRGRDDKQVDADNQAEVQLSHLQDFQPLLQLSSLVQPLSPLTPLSPLHSSAFTNSKLQNSNSKDCPPSKSPHELGVHSGDPESLSSGLNASVPNQHASQTFPPSLPSKPNMTQQKPTAYVRPMDGQDQAPSKSPDLKPPSEDYSEESFGSIAEVKVCARTKLSKLKIPSQPVEETLSNDVNCVEEILKEMTHSWPPPLTAIQTPSTTEPSKFPFQNKDTHVPSGFVGHKKCEIPPKNSQSEKPTLEHDLQISSSDDSDGDQVTEKQCLILFLKESESTSTDSEGASSEGASRAPTPEIDVEASESKKQRLDKENKLSSSSHKESSHKRCVSEFLHLSPRRKIHLYPPLPSPVQKPAKVAHKRPDSTSHSSSQASTMSASDTKVSYQGTASNTTPEQFLPNGNSKSTRPLLKFDDKQYSVEHHLLEAKKIKHKADVMLDKIGKAFNYLDAALSFVESGIAMESEAQPPKSAYTMFSETVDLIKYTLKLINYNDSSATPVEKIFVVLCIRCQSLLSMAMFRFKKDTALKYSRTLSEHFKSSSRTAQAPSPRVARGTGTPSPLSQTPSPASSGGSQPGSVSNGGSVAIPHVIHQLASTYVNITSIFLHGHDLWEQADALAKKNREFFVELDAAVGLLSLTSSMTELVHYVRQGLHWLRLETKLL